MNEKKSCNVYSYHTFYFPFVWDNVGSVSMQDFIANLTQKGKWEDISIDSEYPFEQASDTKIANYQALQYFTSAARNSLFGWDEDFVKCYEYSGIGDEDRYYISKNSELEKKITGNNFSGEYFIEYILNLYGIKLKVYNTGIAILTFEVENKDYSSMKDVKSINELGRRVFAPYFDDESKICYQCATSLGLKLKDKEVLSKISTSYPRNEDECVPEFIRYLLGNIKILPAIDDRMFVACLVSDSEEFKKHLDYEIDETDSAFKNIHLNYKTNEAASKSLYEFVYIDTDNNCTCPTECMRNDLLEQSIYNRWAELTFDGKIEGTIYGISHHSMVCLTAATNKNIIERPFLNIYTHMISAVLAQRASILAFDKKISRCSQDFDKKKALISTRRIKELKKLQDAYIAFLNQHMNVEFTCQEQGIEIYNMLQKEMYVYEEQKLLSKELSLLNDAADTANSLRNNTMAVFLTILFGIISTLPLYDWLVGLCKYITRLF